MSFRGRSFRPRPFSRPPRGGRGAPRPQNASGNFRYPRPESFSGRPAPSSQDDYVGSERRRFEDREHFRKVRPPDEQASARIIGRFVDKPVRDQFSLRTGEVANCKYI